MLKAAELGMVILIDSWIYIIKRNLAILTSRLYPEVMSRHIRSSEGTRTAMKTIIGLSRSTSPQSRTKTWKWFRCAIHCDSAVKMLNEMDSFTHVLLSLNISKMNQDTCCLIFFTRLPFWKIKRKFRECFKHVVSYWSFSGWHWECAAWFSGSQYYFTSRVTVILALTSRLPHRSIAWGMDWPIFFDGFGGTNRKAYVTSHEKIPHIGSFWVLGLIIYCLLAYNLLVARTLNDLLLSLITKRNTWSKFISSISQLLLRTERRRYEIRTVYTKNEFGRSLCVLRWQGNTILYYYFLKLLAVCIFPFWAILLAAHLPDEWNDVWTDTGDCCGALFYSGKSSFWLNIDVYLYK